MHCKNCGHSLQEHENFCSNCGAKVIRNRLTPRVLAEQVNQEILAIDNRLFRTFYALFRAPEDVILGYINGVRKKYQDVLQYFAIALTLTGFQLLLISFLFPDAFEVSESMTKFIESQPGQENNPFKDISYKESTDYQGLGYVLTTPFYAISTYLAYMITGDKQFNLTEHFVINLYYSAQVIFITAFLTLAGVIFGLDYITASLLTIVPLFIYYYFVLKRVFNDSYLVTFAKFLLVQVVNTVIYVILGVIAVVAIVVYELIKKGQL